MWRFIRSPRRLLGSVLLACGLCLCYMIPYAYWDRPRLEVVSVDEGMRDLCLSAQVTVQDESFIYQTWTCVSRKDGQDPGCDVLSAKLNSADFLQRFREAAIQRHGRLSELFHSLGDNRLAFRCKSPKYLPRSQSLLSPLDDFRGMIVCGVFSKRFSAHRPTYGWSDWLQERLPLMPDIGELRKRADELNQDATDTLDAQIRLVYPNLEWSNYWPDNRKNSA